MADICLRSLSAAINCYADRLNKSFEKPINPLFLVENKIKGTLM